MGGGTSTRARDNAYNASVAANDKQKQWNIGMNAGNAAREAQMNEQRAQLMKMSMGMQRAQMAQAAKYESQMQGQADEMAKQRAALKAEMKAKTDTSKLLGDFTDQERRRLFKARKGEGQVGAKDEAISLGQYEKAQGLLGIEKK